MEGDISTIPGRCKTGDKKISTAAHSFVDGIQRFFMCSWVVVVSGWQAAARCGGGRHLIIQVKCTYGAIPRYGGCRRGRRNFTGTGSRGKVTGPQRNLQKLLEYSTFVIKKMFLLYSNKCGTTCFSFVKYKLFSPALAPHQRLSQSVPGISLCWLLLFMAHCQVSKPAWNCSLRLRFRFSFCCISSIWSEWRHLYFVVWVSFCENARLTKIQRTKGTCSSEKMNKWDFP